MLSSPDLADVCGNMVKQQGGQNMVETDIWVADTAEVCVLLRINGREEKVGKSGIADLKSLIGEKAARAGISKYKVKIDGERVDPDDIVDYAVADISKIEIDTYDQVRAF